MARQVLGEETRRGSALRRHQDLGAGFASTGPGCDPILPLCPLESVPWAAASLLHRCGLGTPRGAGPQHGHCARELRASERRGVSTWRSVGAGSVCVGAGSVCVRRHTPLVKLSDLALQGNSLKRTR